VKTFVSMEGEGGAEPKISSKSLFWLRRGGDEGSEKSWSGEVIIGNVSSRSMVLAVMCENNQGLRIIDNKRRTELGLWYYSRV